MSNQQSELLVTSTFDLNNDLGNLLRRSNVTDRVRLLKPLPMWESDKGKYKLSNRALRVRIQVWKEIP